MDAKFAAIGTAAQAVLGALVLLEVINLTDEQLAGIMLAVNALIALFVAWTSPAIPVGPTDNA